MEDQGALYELFIRSDNRVLDLIRRTPSWKYVAPLLNSNLFWYQRTEYLVGWTLEWDENADWKEVYYDFQFLDVKNDPKRTHGVFTDNLLLTPASVKVALDLGYVPDNQALIFAASNGTVGTVALLLKVPGMDVQYLRNTALRIACQKGHVEVVRLLLADGRADPKEEESWCLTLACENGHTEVVKLLLADGRADPRDDDSLALIGAVQFQHPAIVALLLEDGRADPITQGGFPLQEAISIGDSEIEELLRSDPRVQAMLG